ncbi:MAG: hypothetical protein RMJ43_08005 [Chloroherpetonaceae bacterium]|nr:hypothetical protein [Chthonomonadaceae bacterium]MDW8207765.1 hypothetical protein [Chloroherpetonaceae bacterium]
MKRSSIQNVLSVLCLLAATHGLAGSQAPTRVWPNPESRANSDDWLRLRHREIRQLQPRLLVINYVNGLTEDEVRKRVDAIIAAVREASRYHGYRDPQATPFLEYRIAHIANLTDDHPLPESDRMEGNSSLYPRVPDWKEGNNFRYEVLFTEEYAHLLRIPHPDRPGRPVTLGAAVRDGLVHEVWILALQGRFGAPHSVVELKQAYDDSLRKIPGRSVHAGTGAPQDLPFLGRSLRIVHINPERGVGCALENIGRSLEEIARSRAIPYFTRYFTEFTGADLKTRYRTPFSTWEGRQPGTELAYPAPDTVLYRYKGEQFAIRNYVAPPGNVRFPPNARREYDMDNPEPVLSNIEHFRLRDGKDGRDRAEPYTPERIAPYRALAPDCMGPWIVYWLQNLPGLNTRARDDQDLPMRNWWVFLFY